MENFDLRKYLAENKLLKENLIPDGWDEEDISTWEVEPGETIIKAWSAPMEGWDEEHKDMIIIKQKEDGNHYLDGYVSYGDFEEQGPFDSYEEVFKLAVDEMNAFKEDWDEEDPEGDYYDDGDDDEESIDDRITKTYLVKYDQLPNPRYPGKDGRRIVRTWAKSPGEAINLVKVMEDDFKVYVHHVEGDREEFGEDEEGWEKFF